MVIIIIIVLCLGILDQHNPTKTDNVIMINKTIVVYKAKNQTTITKYLVYHIIITHNTVFTN